MEPEAGFEPATCSLRVSCSAELSYPGNGEKCYPTRTVPSNLFANLPRKAVTDKPLTSGRGVG